MVKLEVNNLTEARVPKSALEKRAQEVLSELGLEGSYSISLALINKDKIQTINKNKRNTNEPAGVLSFAEKEIEGPFFEPEKETSLGEILLCPSYIQDKSQKVDRNFKEELLRYFTHGLLHLAGLDHDQMDNLEIDQPH